MAAIPGPPAPPGSAAPPGMPYAPPPPPAAPPPARRRVAAVAGFGVAGISAATARRFGRAGFDVALLARRPERLAAGEADLRAAGGWAARAREAAPHFPARADRAAGYLGALRSSRRAVSPNPHLTPPAPCPHQASRRGAMQSTWQTRPPSRRASRGCGRLAPAWRACWQGGRGEGAVRARGAPARPGPGGPAGPALTQRPAPAACRSRPRWAAPWRCSTGTPTTPSARRCWRWCQRRWTRSTASRSKVGQRLVTWGPRGADAASTAALPAACRPPPPAAPAATNGANPAANRSRPSRPAGGGAAAAAGLGGHRS
jgi:hypothetical protein